MIFGSICSGIEAASSAWLPLGFQCAFTSEIEPFPSAVLKHHYPTTPNYGDITKFRDWPATELDVLIGGTPCQSFSVAGLRKGLDDPRGNLSLVFVGIVEKFAPRWFVWENVPGVLSIDGGRAFGSFLGALAKIGYGFAYRVLDAQYFGLAQRRKRVFVVGHIGGQWQRAAAVLFDTESVRGNPPPRRTPGKGTAHELAPCIGAGVRGFDRAGDPRGQDAVIPIASTLRSGSTNKASHNKASGLEENLITHSLRSDGFDASEDGTGRGTPLVMAHGQANAEIVSDGSPSLNCNHEALIAFTQNQNETGRNTMKVQSGMAVRRLTPRECERLQGFEDDYTLLPGHKADGPRYKALGNSMAVPVIRRIGERIKIVDEIA